MRNARLEAWADFHVANPSVYKLFRQFAGAAIERRVRFGARMIGERIRWYSAVEVAPRNPKGFKVNNNHWPFYARLLMLDAPDVYDGFFERRDRDEAGNDEAMLDALRRRDALPARIKRREQEAARARARAAESPQLGLFERPRNEYDAAYGDDY